jgi:hypothetical protein
LVSVHAEVVSYVKVDFSRETLALFPDLAAVSKKENAIRTCLVLPFGQKVLFEAGSAFVVIKVPSLEGTELWIVARELQESLERAAGFDSVSEPLFGFNKEPLVKMLQDTGSLVGGLA